MRTGKSQPTGKLCELMRFHCGEALGQVINYAAIESGKSISESLRIAMETTYFGHLHQLRMAVSAADIDPMGPPKADVSEAINALACAAGMSPQEYQQQVLIEHAFGVFHAQRMASAGKGREGQE